MEFLRELLESESVKTRNATFQLTLFCEDFSALYPGMQRFVLEATGPNRSPARFITNTYEYSPLLPGSAESAARQMMAIWKEDLLRDPDVVFHEYARPQKDRPARPIDLLILQGSPRPDGNCAIFAQWAVEAAHDANRTPAVIYPHDLDIHPCIGCYQCYNTGTCVFDDDMNDIIAAVRGAGLIVVTSPVYSNTVPAGLKLVIDRMQAYHAERALSGSGRCRHGLIFSVAGRKGKENFACITSVIAAFFHTLGIENAGGILLDGADSVHDIRTIDGEEEKVKALIRKYL
jgi:multimeric flavodoxin WrbA